ncbi:MAG: rhodanese-like domain-containing protein [Desulfuromonadaceae bacterium]|nr:rhodanese-like domain-containing protein [Desulfuromonadaceae bacterium]
MSRKILLTAVIASLSAATVYAADPAAPDVSSANPTIEKICTNCHKAEPNVLRGHFDGVSFKAQAIQVKIDGTVSLVKFDEDDIKVINDARKSGDGELLKDNKIKKGHEIKIEYTEANGVKTAQKLVAKPPVEVSKEMLITAPEIEKLVAKGPAKGGYFLFDSRPTARFIEGAIPTAISLPYPEFDKNVEKLPKDKNALIIFYCSGVTCNMSPGSAAKAKKLGYTNVKVFKDGMPAWYEKNYAELTPQSMKTACKDVPYVVLDARKPKAVSSGFIPGAVPFPAAKAAVLAKSLDIKQKKAPIVVYDGKGGKEAASVAKELVKAGYGNVKVLTGGFDAWKTAKFEVATGNPASKVVYVPKPRPGEIDLDEFKKILAAPHSNVMIVDVRSQAEAKVAKLKDSVVIPLNDIRGRIAEFPKDKQIVLHCNTGVMAEMAYNELKNLGITNVKYVNARFKFEKDGSYTMTKE